MRLQKTFGAGHQFFFISNQAAKTGRKPNYDLKQMQSITYNGQVHCNEKDKLVASNLINNIFKYFEKQFQEGNIEENFQHQEVESLFWNTRILTGHESETGIEAKNLIELEGILELKNIPANLATRKYIHNDFRNFIVNRIIHIGSSRSDTLLHRQLKLKDIEKCLVNRPIISSNPNLFTIDEMIDRATLNEKTSRAQFPENIRRYFVESRNAFSTRFWEDVIHSAKYISNLRSKVWDVCIQQQISGEIIQPLAQYSQIRKGLEALAKEEEAKHPPILVDLHYLHGMFCQLTAECNHNWYKIEE